MSGGLGYPDKPVVGRVRRVDLNDIEDEVTGAAPPAPPAPPASGSNNNLSTGAQVHKSTRAQEHVSTDAHVHESTSAPVHMSTRAQVHTDDAEPSAPLTEADLLEMLTEMGKSPLKDNPCRVPSALVENMGEYMRDNWRLGVTKQALMKRALMLLTHELKTGKALAILGTEKEVGLGE